MCGIIGFSQVNGETLALLPFLVWEMEERGTHSWGVSNGREIWKGMGPATEGWGKIWEVAADNRGQPLMVHTRAASVGERNLANSHPWAFERGTGRMVEPSAAAIIGCHNGTLTNWKTLNDKYNRKFEVDSQHIFAHMAAGLPTKEINGTGVLLWFEDGEMRCLRFYSTAMHLMKLKNGTLVMCSEERPMVKATRMMGVPYEAFYKLESQTEYRMPHGVGPFTGRRMEFSGWTSGYTRGTSAWSGTASNVVWSGDNACWVCNAELTGIPKGMRHLLCESCHETELWRMVDRIEKDKAQVIHHGKKEGKARGHHG